MRNFIVNKDTDRIWLADIIEEHQLFDSTLFSSRFLELTDLQTHSHDSVDGELSSIMSCVAIDTYGTPIGLATIEAFDLNIPNTISISDVTHRFIGVFSVFVAKERRNEGVATEMLRELENLARKSIQNRGEKLIVVAMDDAFPFVLKKSEIMFPVHNGFDPIFWKRDIEDPELLNKLFS